MDAGPSVRPLRSAARAIRWAVITWSTRRRSRLDMPELEQVESERLDLPNDAEQRGPILDQAGEHGLAFLQLSDQRWKS
jgi:hypothetical protein